MKAIIDANELKRIIDNTKKFTGYNSRLMEYIHLEINSENKTIRAVALDGHRISVEYARIEDADQSFTCFIKPMLPKITKKTNYAVVELNDKRLLVDVEGNITGFTQPEGEFYKIDKLIEDEMKKESIDRIGVNAKYLKDALCSAKTVNTKEIIEIDVRGPKEPLVIKTKGHRGLPKNIKIILPVVINSN